MRLKIGGVHPYLGQYYNTICPYSANQPFNVTSVHVPKPHYITQLYAISQQCVPSTPWEMST